jgi:hypothetical protein
MIHLARLAVERDCGRFEWSVLDWNTPAIDFYRGLGALPLEEWTVQRVSGDALHALAERALAERAVAEHADGGSAVGGRQSLGD